MAAGITYVYEHCGNMIPVLTYQEFFIDQHGYRRKFNHPYEDRTEALNANVRGLSGVLYCPKCRGLRDVVLSRIENHVNTDYPEVCPDCGNELKGVLEGECCPACGVGKLKTLNRWAT